MCSCCNHSCCCCRKIRAKAHKKMIKSLEKNGYNHYWTPTDQWRDRWWFFGEKRKQQKEVKIGYIFDTGTPVAMYKWKTREIS